MRVIDGPTIEANVDWLQLVDALKAGHALPKAEIGDTLLWRQQKKFLVRSAWIEGLGACTKSVTVYPENPSKKPALPSVQGQVLLFDEESGAPVAMLDGPAETRLKTAADSALGSSLLSRENSEFLLMVGAGNMARSLIEAHLAVRPSLQKVLIWNRTPKRAQELAALLTKELEIDAEAVIELDEAVPEADIVCSATMAHKPLIKGDYVSPGTHIDLVGAYTQIMREADNETLIKARLFSDCFETTLEHIGEYRVPLAEGTIKRSDILADYYGLLSGEEGRLDDDDITVCKNGGGAH
ncbi:MAG: NAD(P)-binding domain-containing protein, partial [Rhizobiales bacterium]|nr:NAD(P)-binding domain-containing protein [Hyphomicrobiales bacterium]